MSCERIIFSFFFFNDTATTEIYTLSLHDALPISHCRFLPPRLSPPTSPAAAPQSPVPSSTRSRSAGSPSQTPTTTDRKSTRLNSSHLVISYAVFCLKKKKPDPYNMSCNKRNSDDI